MNSKTLEHQKKIDALYNQIIENMNNLTPNIFFASGTITPDKSALPPQGSIWEIKPTKWLRFKMFFRRIWCWVVLSKKERKEINDFLDRIAAWRPE